MVIVPGMNNNDRPPRIDQPVTDRLVGGIDATHLDWESAQNDKAKARTCFQEDAENCVARRGDGKYVMIVGDSHTIMMTPAFTKLAEQLDLMLSMSVAYGCAWPKGIAYAHRSPEFRADCKDLRNDWYGRVIPKLDPDVIILIIRALDDPALPIAIVDELGKPIPSNRRIAFLDSVTSQTISLLQEGDRKIVLMEPIPLSKNSFNPLICLSKAVLVEECRYVTASSPSALERIFRREAIADNVSTIDLDHAICPFYPICDPVVNGLIVKWDSSHITATYAVSIVDQLKKALDDTGAFGD